MADLPFHILSLASGVGMLDESVRLVVPGARVVCHVEREAYCAEVLAARAEEEGVAPPPCWSDLRAFDGKPWRGVVDCLTAGYPCQPFSYAGKRAGERDPRHLWPHVARVIAEVRPGVVFLENVAGHLTLGFPVVRRELEGLGYRVTAGLFTASEVGAPHRRTRLFILAVDDGAGGGCGELREPSGGGGFPDGRGECVADARRERPQGIGGDGSAARATGRAGGTLAHTERAGSRAGDPIEQGGAEIGRGRSTDDGRGVADAELVRRYDPEASREDGTRGATAEAGGAVADAADDGWRLDEKRGPEERAAHHGAGTDCLGIFPPGPSDHERWRAILAERPDLAPATEPRLRGLADGMANRNDRLRAGGNGVVALAGAYALCALWAALQE